MYIFCSPIFISDRDFLKAQTPANGGRLFEIAGGYFFSFLSQPSLQDLTTMLVRANRAMALGSTIR